MDECLSTPEISVLGLLEAAAGDTGGQALMAWPRTEPATPTGFQHCHLSSVYQRGGVGRGSDRPGPKLKIAQLRITSQAGKVR